MDHPAQEQEPENGSEHKLQDRHEEPSLEQLAKPGNEETAQRGDDVSGRTLSCHAGMIHRREAERNQLTSSPSGKLPNERRLPDDREISRPSRRSRRLES